MCELERGDAYRSGERREGEGRELRIAVLRVTNI